MNESLETSRIHRLADEIRDFVPGDNEESLRNANADTASSDLELQEDIDVDSDFDVESSTLSEDTFSFLIVAPCFSTSFFTGVLVFAIKTTMYTLLLADMMTKGTPNNVLAIPASLKVPVVISQVLAIVITVVTQDDLITSLQLFHTGYKGIKSSFENVNYLKWFCPLFLLAWNGAYGLLVTFLLIIISPNVFYLILTFTAIQFISFLDNIVFSLSSIGFFGSANRSTAMLVRETKFPARTNLVSWLHFLSLSISFVGMLSGLAVVVFLQASGYFLPFSIIVQFDDEIIPALSTYSGEFILEVNGPFFAQDRVVYRNSIGGGTIGFCSDMEAWTFGHSRSNNYCENIMAMSQNPTSRDISLVLGRPWYVRKGKTSERVLPMEDIFSAASCYSDVDCGGSERGRCNSFRCICKDGAFGLRCNYLELETCETIRVDELTDPFNRLGRKVSQKYTILRDNEGKIVTAYHHPVYIDATFDKNNPKRKVDVVLYSGLRWVLSSIDYTKGELHAHFPPWLHISEDTLGDIEAASEKVSFNTAADDSSAPIKVGWFLPGSSDITSIDPVLSINTVFVCSKCGELYPCANGNQCINASGTCDCKHGESGSLCQVLPIGDGRCNEFFNKQEFDFDGGDCCEGSCKSGPRYKCGITEENGLDSIPSGFPFCIDPAFGCRNGESDCWSIKSKGIPLLIKESSGAFVTLSANGRTLVISEPEVDTVRVFDQVDSKWIQRGQTLEGEGKSRFGTLVALATLPGIVFRRRSGRVPITLAVAAVGNITNYVEVYKFDPHDTEWSRQGSPLQFREKIDSLSIGGEGGKFSLAIGLRKSNRCYLYLQDKDFNWKLAFNTSGSSGVALSGNGKLLGCPSTNPSDGSQGSGLFRVSNISIPNPYDIQQVNNRVLPNLLPFGVYNFAFQSRPVVAVIDYKGTSGAILGQVAPNTYGLNNFSMFGLQFDSTNYITFVDRLAELKVDILESMAVDVQPVFSVSPDTRFLAINSQKSVIELFHVAKDADVTDFVIPLYPNSSKLPKYRVAGYKSKFSISNEGLTMAVIDQDNVNVIQRKSFCQGTPIRIAITLDEEPGLISWSLDYVANVATQEIPSESIANCQNCYDGDPRYIRVVILEDFCIPKERADCVQITFVVEDRQMSDGAGFIALIDGKNFSNYVGAYETKGITLGGCKKVCTEKSKKVSIALNFTGGFPSELRNPLGSILWSSKSTPSTVWGNMLMIEVCILYNETGKFEMIGSGGFGNWTIFIDDMERLRYSFDIGRSQFFEIDLDESSGLIQNIPSRCYHNCSICNVCPPGMVADASKEVDIGGFSGISCSELATIGSKRGLSSEFCSLLPKNISTLCGCYQAVCLRNESNIRVDIEFDKFPQDISWLVTDSSYNSLWEIGFENYNSIETSKFSTFESCVPEKVPLLFSIRDKNSNGLCCDSESSYFFPSGDKGYVVYLDGVMVGARKFPMGSKQELVLRAGRTSSLARINQTAVWCEGCQKCNVCPDDSDYNHDENIHFELYGEENCFQFDDTTSRFITSEFCSEIQAHVFASCGCRNFQPKCSDNESLFIFKTIVEESPGVVTLKIMSEKNRTVLSKVGFLGAIGETKDYKACIPTSEDVYVGVYHYCSETKLCLSSNRSEYFELTVNGYVLARDRFTKSSFEYSLSKIM